MSAVVFLLIGSTFLSQCSARSLAVNQVEDRLFGGPTGYVSVYDPQDGQWVFIAAKDANPADFRVQLATAPTPSNGSGRSGAGSAGLVETGGIQVKLQGTPDEVARLTSAVDILAGTRYGSAALGDLLARNDITIRFANDIGVDLPGGHVLTTGGTAMTEGKTVTISRHYYGNSSDRVLAAMVAHELTHVAQNVDAGSAWWQWPWTTVDREVSAHLMQAVVWAEVRGNEQNWEQDQNLQNATNRDQLRTKIMENPAYPWWLAPDLSC
ncbi:MAG: eCIS core domain-containing protein [Chloroflexota bacterium]